MDTTGLIFMFFTSIAADVQSAPIHSIPRSCFIGKTRQGANWFAAKLERIPYWQASKLDAERNQLRMKLMPFSNHWLCIETAGKQTMRRPLWGCRNCLT